jgi:hypothetical protein
MPVYRYRTHEEAHRARWKWPGDPRLGSILRQVLHTGERMWPLARPAGVRRFRTLAEASAWRATWSRKPR